jgi:hypothetical protein
VPPAQTCPTPWIKVSRTTLVTGLRADGRRIRILSPPDVPTEGASVLWTAIHGSSGPEVEAVSAGTVGVLAPSGRLRPFSRSGEGTCPFGGLGLRHCSRDPTRFARKRLWRARARIRGRTLGRPFAPSVGEVARLATLRAPPVIAVEAGDALAPGRRPHEAGAGGRRDRAGGRFRWSFVGGSAHKRGPQFGASHCRWSDVPILERTTGFEPATPTLARLQGPVL